MESLIPTFASDGRRLRSRSLSSVERLLVLDSVAVIRNRKGAIVAAHLRPSDGSNPIRNAAHMGQSYSFEQPLPSGHAAWKHRDLIGDKQDRQTLYDETFGDVVQADLFVRRIFRNVPLSCMKRPERSAAAAPRQAKVVSINLGRRRKSTVSRPLEFDSELRAA